MNNIKYFLFVNNASLISYSTTILIENGLKTHDMNVDFYSCSTILCSGSIRWQAKHHWGFLGVIGGIPIDILAGYF